MHKDSIFAVGERDRPVEIPDQSEIPVIPIVNDASVVQRHEISTDIGVRFRIVLDDNDIEIARPGLGQC